MQNEFTPLSGDSFQLNLPWSLPTEQGQNQSQPQATATFNAGLTITEDLAGVVQNMGGVTGSTVGLVNNETTLCSIAFHLIVQCNRAGKDVLELETKLRYGYRMPALPGEGCRVDNRTLLTVLAELV
ncbi:hypothetical protein ASPVEDRAFT_523957 [Aspergillus versicolor CBS 583.65]|uniref:Uncharacterized protein n=1 Tax=Aspergillus versicolor CBS 583.65 TaxID=1036611 RepID=A0A1L9PDX4_ASPVE|nr:uncharacterized protein ASPVEDRAFT_523957 [Aspergillus versicolor CBS 583.65]OJI99733.1 hypothetical protein ASPVEDRAFT_523957 [Aspergillus versicolor CBS 583.65]